MKDLCMLYNAEPPAPPPEPTPPCPTRQAGKVCLRNAMQPHLLPQGPSSCHQKQRICPAAQNFNRIGEEREELMAKLGDLKRVLSSAEVPPLSTSSFPKLTGESYRTYWGGGWKSERKECQLAGSMLVTYVAGSLLGQLAGSLLGHCLVATSHPGLV